MGKRDKSVKKTPLAAPAQLTHNPFAQLVGAPVVAPSIEADAATHVVATAVERLAVAATLAGAATGAIEVAAERPAAIKRRGRLILRRETKHRGGKAVIVIGGFEALADHDRAALETLAKELKQLLGCGGAVEHEREIVLQGDRPAKVAELLRAKGFRVEGVTA